MTTETQSMTAMRSTHARAYGAPDVVTIEEREIPTPGRDEVLVRVEAASVGSADSASRLGEPGFVRLFFGLRRPRQPVLGSDFAGTVVAAGDDVADFAVGDRVFGSTGARAGGHTQFLAVAESSAIAHLPESVSFAHAVALTDGALTALPFLRDTGRLTSGARVLINGASGAVGSSAIQLAKHLGAHVTAVTSGPNAAVVRELGASDVLDYTVDDFTTSGQRWDVIFDAVGTSSFGKARRVLTPAGIYLSTVPGAILLQSLFTKRAAIAFTGLRPDAAKRPDLVELARLTAEGVLTPLIDSSYPLGSIAAAHERVDSKRKRGTVVLTPQDENSGRTTQAMAKR